MGSTGPFGTPEPFPSVSEEWLSCNCIHVRPFFEKTKCLTLSSSWQTTVLSMMVPSARTAGILHKEDLFCHLLLLPAALIPPAGTLSRHLRRGLYLQKPLC